MDNLVQSLGRFMNAGTAPEMPAHAVFRGEVVDDCRDNPRAQIEETRAVYLEEETHICVTVNGQGFDAQYAENIFQAFQRLRGYSLPGSGLGLATCRRIADRFGGRVWAESTPGVGSKFYVSFRAELVIQTMAAIG